MVILMYVFTPYGANRNPLLTLNKQYLKSIIVNMYSLK